MIAKNELLTEIGWKNKGHILAGLLSLGLKSLPSNSDTEAGSVRGGIYHQQLANAAAAWLKSQGKTWAAEKWHAGYRCDLIADDIIIEVGNTDPDRALEHLRQTNGRFCVIPYQDGEPLTVLIFRRGPEWDTAHVDTLLLEKDKHSQGMLDQLGAE